VAFGEDAAQHIGDPSYSVAKWFKVGFLRGCNERFSTFFQLFLHPPDMQKSSAGQVLSYPPLPSGVTIEQVYADFLGFLYRSTGEFFKQNINGGDAAWPKLQHNMEFVFAIPNGWDQRQQGFLRDAAIDAGLLPERNSDERIKFITEAEASVHFAMAHSDTRQWMKPGVIFAILDAGGSTVDTTLYRCKTVTPHLTLDEVCRCECVQVSKPFPLYERIAQYIDTYLRLVGCVSTTRLLSSSEKNSEVPDLPKKKTWD
jgi:hypothetical protein